MLILYSFACLRSRTARLVLGPKLPALLLNTRGAAAVVVAGTFAGTAALVGTVAVGGLFVAGMLIVALSAKPELRYAEWLASRQGNVSDALRFNTGCQSCLSTSKRTILVTRAGQLQSA